MQESFKQLNTDQIKNLSNCMAICKACAAMCIEQGQKKTAIVCNECADVCDLALKFACTNSQFKEDLLAFCSDVCNKCADVCHTAQAQHCKDCGDICKKCADTCSTTYTKR